MRIAERFSAAMDRFSRPCDYQLFSCKAEMSPKSREKQQSDTVPRNVTRTDEMRRDGRGGGMREERGSNTEQKKDDGLPDRQTALLQAIKEILGMAQTQFNTINKVVKLFCNITK